MHNPSHLFRNLVCGSVIGIALACAPGTQKAVDAPVALPPVALSAPTQDDRADGVELAAEESLGNAGRSERVSFRLVRDLRLVPSMDEVGLSEVYSAYVQDGISKHGRRNYTDARLPVLLRDRPFCVVRFHPFDSDEQRDAARAKVMTKNLAQRLRNTDLARTLVQGETLTFVVDRTTQRFDAETHLESIMLFTANPDSPYIAKMKCVGKQSNVETLRSAFGVRVIRGLE